LLCSLSSHCSIDQFTGLTTIRSNDSARLGHLGPPGAYASLPSDYLLMASLACVVCPEWPEPKVHIDSGTNGTCRVSCRPGVMFCCASFYWSICSVGGTGIYYFDIGDECSYGSFDLNPNSALTQTTFQAFVTMVWHTRVFKPENLTGNVGHPYCLICLSILGFITLVLAVAVAALERFQIGVVLAGLGSSCIQFVCLWWANGRTADRRGARLLLLFISGILIAEVLPLLVCFLVALFRNNVIVGFDATSKVRANLLFYLELIRVVVCTGPLSVGVMGSSFGQLPRDIAEIVLENEEYPVGQTGL
jgi:hypothetical protein